MNLWFYIFDQIWGNFDHCFEYFSASFSLSSRIPINICVTLCYLIGLRLCWFFLYSFFCVVQIGQFLWVYYQVHYFAISVDCCHYLWLDFSDFKFSFGSFCSYYSFVDISYLLIHDKCIFPYIPEHSYNNCFKILSADFKCMLFQSWSLLIVFSLENGSHFPVFLYVK